MVAKSDKGTTENPEKDPKTAADSKKAGPTKSVVTAKASSKKISKTKSSTKKTVKGKAKSAAKTAKNATAKGGAKKSAKPSGKTAAKAKKTDKKKAPVSTKAKFKKKKQNLLRIYSEMNKLCVDAVDREVIKRFKIIIDTSEEDITKVSANMILKDPRNISTSSFHESIQPYIKHFLFLQKRESKKKK